jgi:hypothetical protein
VTWCWALPDWSSIVVQWLYNWQTLIGAGLALIAALSVTVMTKRQMAQAAKFNVDQIERAHAGARVVLPLALSDISGICQRIADAIAAEIEQTFEAEPLAEIAEVFDVPDFLSRFPSVEMSGSTLAAMQSFVETLTAASDVRHTAELISSAQILLSRYRSFDLRSPAVEDQLFGLLIDAAKVQMLADAMFNYARFVDSMPFGLVGSMNNADAWDRILQKAHGLVFLRARIDIYSKPISIRIRRYKEIDKSPWNEIFEF